MVSVFGYFQRREEAEQAKQELEKKGYTGMSIDTVEKYPDSHNGQLNGPLSPRVNGLSSLVLTSGSDPGYSDVVRPMLAADPMVSGMSNEMDEIADANNLLVVVTEDGNLGEVKQIIEQCGGDA